LKCAFLSESNMLTESAFMEEKKKTRSRGSSALRSLELQYTPVFDLHLNMAIDYETSVFINDRKMGVLLPERYLPVAEKSNQICEIEKWAVEEGCDAIVRCRDRDVDINRLIMRTSVRHLSKKNFLARMLKITEAKGVSPDKFCFNVKESILEKEKAQVLANFDAMREAGFLVCIDDFGVEFTSLSRLGHYRVDYIGIDSSLLHGILTEERSQNMLQGLIDFAKKLNMQVKVNGVDTQELADLLRLMGVDQMKGKLYGEAISEKKIS